MDDDVAPSLRPRHGVVEQPSLVLDIAAHLIRPDNYNTVELAVLGLLHRQCCELVRGIAAMLSAKRHFSSDHSLDVRSAEFYSP